MQNFSYIQSIEKWLRYRLLDYAVLHGILQSAGQCSGPFHLEGNHAKFQLRLFRVSVVRWVGEKIRLQPRRLVCSLSTALRSVYLRASYGSDEIRRAASADESACV